MKLVFIDKIASQSVHPPVCRITKFETNPSWLELSKRFLFRALIQMNGAKEIVCLRGDLNQQPLNHKSTPTSDYQLQS